MYTENWVSAGGNEASIGGAVAIFFEYSSVSKTVVGVVVSHSQFINNYAYGELCSAPNQAGQGGGLAVVGAARPAVIVAHCNFTNNLAMTASKRSSSYAKSASVSLGGAMSIALSSNVTIDQVNFDNNLAYNGAGNDMSSISGQSDQENFVYASDCTFKAGTKVSQSILLQQAVLNTVDICSTLQTYIQQAKDMVIDKSSQSVHYTQHHANAHSARTEAAAIGDDVASTFFSVPAIWKEHLSAAPSIARASHPASLSQSASNSDATTAVKTSSSLFTQMADAGKRARWHYLQSWDSALLSRPGARQRVNRIVNRILQLDLWKEQGQEAEEPGAEVLLDIPVDSYFVGRASTAAANGKHSFVGRRNGMSVESLLLLSKPRSLNSVHELESAYRQALYAELDAEFDRLRGESDAEGWNKAAVASDLAAKYEDTASRIQVMDRGNDSPSEQMQSEATTSAQRVLQSTSVPFAPTDVLLNFHPYVVITSGRAYFENPTFQGVYHMFFGDFPQIAKYSNTDNYITNAIKAVPSDSAIFGHINQEDLTITAISATIEIFDSNDDQDYSIRQINLFNATLQLNRNATVSGGSFVTGSLITGVDATTSSLIPYVQGGESHPFVTFSDRVYTGVSLQSIFAAFGSALGQTADSSTNSTEQTVVSVNSVSTIFVACHLHNCFGDFAFYFLLNFFLFSFFFT